MGTKLTSEFPNSHNKEMRCARNSYLVSRNVPIERNMNCFLALTLSWSEKGEGGKTV